MHNCEVSVYDMFSRMPTQHRPVAIPNIYAGQLLQEGAGAQTTPAGFILMQDLSTVAGNAALTSGLNQMQLEQVCKVSYVCQ